MRQKLHRSASVQLNTPKGDGLAHFVRGHRRNSLQVQVEEKTKLRHYLVGRLRLMLLG
jgi:hypothetical protein